MTNSLKRNTFSADILSSLNFALAYKLSLHENDNYANIN